MLGRLKSLFPKASVHAYTATATKLVQEDIVEQLKLDNAEILIGNFDRANLTYKVLSRQSSSINQIMAVIERHSGEGGIIYCISRKNVDSLCQRLNKLGLNAMPYHAGMSADDRAATQDAFLQERCDIVVATVAFGMGIDRSNVRYVIHAGMPKSVEHYQQEAGRAGRDGLPAECLLLHSGVDFFSWKSIIEKSANDPEVNSQYIESALKHLSEMDAYCRQGNCRHGMLVRYFGQELEEKNCQACDICLGQTKAVDDATIIAQKIISCIARLQERFGVGYIISVLRGENLQIIRERKHEQLSTYGLLKEFRSDEIKDWIYQLLYQKLLSQEEVEMSSGTTFSRLHLNKYSWEVLRKQREVQLMRSTLEPKEKGGKKGKRGAGGSPSTDGSQVDSSPVDKKLFETMRVLRRKLADERNVPPYIIFSDATLGELARIKPKSLIEMRRIHGIGDMKLSQYGQVFLDLILDEI
jgi:ATP-dependent DNA helicase RecQ